MFDIKWIRDNPDDFDAGLKKRGLDPMSAEVVRLDDARKSHIQTLQDAQERRNAASKAIGNAKASGDEAEAKRLIDEVADLKGFIQTGEDEERRLTDALTAFVSGIPNLPLDEVPVGTDEADNVVHHVHGEKPRVDDAKQHFEIGEALGLMDFEAAAKLSGARFVVLKAALARLERAIANFMLDTHTGEFGYMEVNPPVLVRDHVLFRQEQGWHRSCLPLNFALGGYFDGTTKYVRYFGTGGGVDNIGRGLSWLPTMRVPADGDPWDMEHELYDLGEDPGEMVNLAVDPTRRREVEERFAHLIELERTAYRHSRPAGRGVGSTHRGAMLDEAGGDIGSRG